MNRTSRRLSAIVLSSVLLTFSACGSDDPAPAADDEGAPAATAEDPSDSPTQDPAGSDEEAEPEGQPAPAGGEVLGVVVVDGTSYDMDEVRRCEPLEDDPFETELELQARGTVPAGQGFGGEDYVQIDVYVRSTGGVSLNEVSWAGPEGVFGGPPDPVIDIEGDEVTGSATPVEAMTQEGSVDVEFTLPVPAELLDCRA